MVNLVVLGAGSRVDPNLSTHFPMPFRKNGRTTFLLLLFAKNERRAGSTLIPLRDGQRQLLFEVNDNYQLL